MYGIIKICMNYMYIYLYVWIHIKYVWIIKIKIFIQSKIFKFTQLMENHALKNYTVFQRIVKVKTYM